MKITIVNTRTDESISMDSYVFGEGVLVTEFDPGSIPATFNKIKGVNQNGVFRTETTLEPRPMELTAIILNSSRASIEAVKSQIDNVLNPLDELKFLYTSENIIKECLCAVGSTPKYAVENILNSNEALEFKVSFECFNPFWMDQTETVLNVETWEDGFEFEFELVDDGIEFAKKGANEIEILNGTVQAPIEIFFKGPALNPKITLNNKEFIKVNKSIDETDTLYIKTNYGETAVEIRKPSGTEQAYNYLDIESKFFSLNPGKNTLVYATDGDFLPQSVIIQYKKHYLSL